LIIGALQNRTKSEVLVSYFYPGNDPYYWDEEPLAPEISAIATGSFKAKQPPDIKGSEYLVDSLEAALWALHRSDWFREGALLAVNLGDESRYDRCDLRTVGWRVLWRRRDSAEWKAAFAMRELIIELADRLYDFAN
jgi:ADP-ribosyl-[dinitrogen reductase] hydrolase